MATPMQMRAGRSARAGCWRARQPPYPRVVSTVHRTAKAAQVLARSQSNAASSSDEATLQHDDHDLAERYHLRWSQLVKMEVAEERQQFEERINNTSDKDLERRGLALLDMMVDRLYTDKATGKQVVVLSRQKGKPIGINHDFGPGDFVWLRSMEGRLSSAHWEGQILDIRVTMRVELYEREEDDMISEQVLTSDQEDELEVASLEEGVPIRVDKGFNRVAYDRQLDALDAIDPEEPLFGDSAVNHHPSLKLQYDADDEAMTGTHLRDVLVVSEPALLASKHSSLLQQHMHSGTEQHTVPGLQLLQQIWHLLTGSKELIQQVADAAHTLNATQQAAIANALSHRLALIHGPPGTGKTTCTAYLVQFAKHTMKLSAPMLVCAQSNTAVDKIVEELINLDLKVLRIGSPTRISPNLMSVTFEARCQSHPLYKTLQASIQRIVELNQKLATLQKDLRSAAKSRQARRIRYDLYQAREEKRHAVKQTESWRRELYKAVVTKSEVVCCTCIGAGGAELKGFSFPVLILDEGSQATEPEALVPFMKGIQQAIIVGDHKQLPPTICSRKAEEGGLPKSLFERMMEAGVPSVMLAVQYRSHPLLFDFPNQRFYNGGIQSGVLADARPLPVPFPPSGTTYKDWQGGSSSPLAFINITGKEQVGANGVSKFNIKEAGLTASLVQYILQEGVANGLKPGDIGVVTPYAAQVEKIIQQLRRLGISSRGRKQADVDPSTQPGDSLAGQPAGAGGNSVLVSSVDGFQGKEQRIILFSTVRSNPEGKIGFLEDQRRLNVAITRAKNLLIVIGNMATLSSKCPHWQAWMAYIQEHGLVLQAADVQRALQAASKEPPPASHFQSNEQAGYDVTEWSQ